MRWFATCGLLGGLIGGALAYAGTPLLPTTYTAQSQLVMRDPNSLGTSFGGVGSINVSTDPAVVAQVMRSDDVAEATSDLLNGQLTAAEVGDQVSITPDGAAGTVTVEATAETASLAQQLADAVPEAYQSVEAAGYAEQAEQTAAVLEELRAGQQARLAEIQAQLAAMTNGVYAAAPLFVDPGARAAYVRATLETDVAYQQLQNQAASLASSINGTTELIEQSNANFQLLDTGVDQVIAAQTPTDPTSPVLLRNVAIGFLMGAFIGAAIAWIATDRRRVVDPAAAAAALDAPLLGSFEPQRELMRFPRLANLASDGPPGNELKVLSSSLILSATRRNIGSIVITSARGREGKTVLAANIAAAAQFTGHAVALVDAANGRAPLTDALELSEEPGLSEIFDGGVLRESVHVFSFGEGDDDDCALPVVPIGQKGWRQEPGRRLNEKRRATWMAAVRASSPITAIVDTPAVNSHALPLQLAQSGGLVVVVSPRTTLADLELIRMRADVADVVILGFIRNEYRAGARARRSWLLGRGGAQGRLTRRPDLAKPDLGPEVITSAGTEAAGARAALPSKQEADSLR